MASHQQQASHHVYYCSYDGEHRQKEHLYRLREWISQGIVYPGQLPTAPVGMATTGGNSLSMIDKDLYAIGTKVGLFYDTTKLQNSAAEASPFSHTETCH
jgi:hypothetical protein